jgi:U32 family peptidase
LTELAAPAGDPEALRAAVNHGADAVYLGLRRFGARARAANFSEDELAAAVASCRPRGVRLYVTLNTLVFDGELEAIEATIARVAELGVDAIIVQDLGVAAIARAVCPELAIHASTQTAVGHADGCRMLADLGVERLVVPRELSVERIRRLRAQTDLELEVFIHGSLCFSWSGQCLASLARGGRSGNRGDCAQPCRLPYRVLRDGEPVADRGVTHPLSPGDLWAVDQLAALVDAGVDSFKIEGRLKRPEYVASAVFHYRALLDRIASDPRASLSVEERRDLLQPFHRSPSPGYLGGVDHNTLVVAGGPGAQGLPVGRVVAAAGRELILDRARLPLKAGDGISLGDDRGGRVHEVTALAGGRVQVRMGPDFPTSAADVGQRLTRTDDPALTRRLRLGVEGRSRTARPHRHPVTAQLGGQTGEPLTLRLDDGEGNRVDAASERALERAREHPLDPATVRERLGRMGETPFCLDSMSWDVGPGLTLPLGQINRLRREACAALEQRRAAPPRRRVTRGREWQRWPSPAHTDGDAVPRGLTVLCRSATQADAVSSIAGVAVLIADPPAGVDPGPLVQRARDAGIFAVAALPRTVMQGEAPLPRRTPAADGLLLRNLAQLAAAGSLTPTATLLGDLSFNAVNNPSASLLLAAGLATLAPGADLDAAGVCRLAGRLDPTRLEVILHGRLPLFHTRHCLFAARLAGAATRAACGAICHDTTLALVDDAGRVNPVLADERCRNTVLDADVRDWRPELAALRRAGLVRFRVELVDETGDQARDLLESVIADLSATP